MALRLGAVAAACSKAEEIEEENKAVLQKARRVEEEVNGAVDYEGDLTRQLGGEGTCYRTWP